MSRALHLPLESLLGIPLVLLVAAGGGCKTNFRHVSSQRQADTVDGGLAVAFVVTPTSVNVNTAADDFGLNLGAPVSFCQTPYIELTGTLTNHSGAPMYVSATAAGNYTLPYFKHAGVSQTPSSGSKRYSKSLRSIEWSKMQLVNDNDFVSFKINPLCPVDPSTSLTTDYAYDGIGIYTFTVQYQYTGMDYGPKLADGGVPPTFKDPVTSAEVTVNAY